MVRNDGSWLDYNLPLAYLILQPDLDSISSGSVTNHPCLLGAWDMPWSPHNVSYYVHRASKCQMSRSRRGNIKNHPIASTRTDGLFGGWDIGDLVSYDLGLCRFQGTPLAPHSIPANLLGRQRI
jgi:hypothetical protein